MKRHKRAILLIAVILVLLGGGLVGTVYHGVIILNDSAAATYPVKGVDVSGWQGEIDWPILASQEIDFAFIKATEGSSFTDANFAFNWEEASHTSLLIGAYHFFSYDSSGSSQAEHFIATVPRLEGALPPVVDVEFYGDKEDNPPDREQVRTELTQMLNLLEDHYGQKPILYTTMPVYALYFENEYAEYPLWIRDIWKEPSLPDERAWQFWQYTNRERFEGYHGTERFIDMNVFRGSLDDLAAMGFVPE